MSIKEEMKIPADQTKDVVTYVRFPQRIHDEIEKVKVELNITDRSKVIRKFTEYALGLYRGKGRKGNVSESTRKEFQSFMERHQLSNLDVAEMMIVLSEK
jgi:hypothetical protein